MAENWAVYMCRVNDELASVCVDLSLKDVAPNRRLPVLGWVFVEMNAPRPDGLPSPEESPRLKQIEDGIVSALDPMGAKLAGLIGNVGRRELYFYLRSAEGFERTVANAMKAFPDYRYEADSQPDPGWNQYIELLYPKPPEMRVIQNMEVLAALAEHGDRNSQPRVIDHFVFFTNLVAQSDYSDWAKSRGFEVEISNVSGLFKRTRFGLKLSRTDTVEPDSINAITSELEEHATALGAVYDGWGSPVIRDEPPPTIHP